MIPRPLRRKRGGSALEAAIVLPALVMFLAVGVDFAYLGLVEHQMAHAARSASRFGITGQAPQDDEQHRDPVRWCEDATPSASPRVERIRQIIARKGGALLKPSGLCLTLKSYTGFQAVGRPEPLEDTNGNKHHDGNEAFTDLNMNGRWDADSGLLSPGNAGEVVVYTLRYVTEPLTGLTPGLAAGRQITFQSRVVVHNEPF